MNDYKRNAAKMTKKNPLERLTPYLFVGPAIMVLVVFVIYPMFYLIYSSFTGGSLISAKTTLVGMQNYRDLFASADFIRVMQNTAKYTALLVLQIIILATFIALWFGKKGKIYNFAQSAVFTPHIISLVSVSLVWLWLLDPQIGFLNSLLKMVRLPECPWLTSPGSALHSLIMVSLWRETGYYSLLIIAALKSIPKEIFEAAALDDAGQFAVLSRITIPMISPTLFFILVVASIGSFQVFDTINIMTQGGPINSTNVFVYFIYEYAFKFFKIGYASAAGVLLLILVSAITMIYFKILGKQVHYK